MLAQLSRVPVQVVVDSSRVFAQSNPRLVGDNARLRALGWSPRIPPEQMIAELLDHWRGRTAPETT